ncbi:MAG TPA: metal-sensitive transcriptional regulator [Usitatibacter sp.]|nr:metal-sensitive transcriptional regulator [Usitatibacter sp.]
MEAIRDAKRKREMVLRLKRIEGQLRGIQAMIAEGEDCEKVVQQLSAARSALDKAFFNVIACAVEAEAGSERRVREVAGLLAKFG